MAIYSIPGVRPGRSRRSGGGRVVIGGKFRGNATPSNLVPFEYPKAKSDAAERAQRRKDVADALHFVRDCPNSAKEKLAETRAAAESVKLA